MGDIDNSIQSSFRSRGLERSPATINTVPIFPHIYSYSPNLFDFENDLLPSTDVSGHISNDVFDDIYNPTIGTYHQSTTVNPICPSSTSLVTSPFPNQEQVNQQLPLLQLDSADSKKIQIVSQPRPYFRPRTEKERQDSSHYIRCKKNSQHEYPTIIISEKWSKVKSLIEVTLVGIDNQPHLYAIDNKERLSSSTLFKLDKPNSLYFYVTDKDLQQGTKTFLIEFIKGKQVGSITKQIIRERQLNQSKLRFTRYCQIADDTYQVVDGSMAYSSVMTEDYGPLKIDDVSPSYGPMRGNEKVHIEIKGQIPADFKKNLNINITGDGYSWSHQIEKIEKNDKNFTFRMPKFPNDSIERANVYISIEYKQKIIYQAGYRYLRSLDRELAEGNDNGSVTCGAVAAFPTSNGCDPLSVWPSTGMGLEGRGTKRLRQ